MITWIQGVGDTRGVLAPIRNPCEEDSIKREILCFSSYEEVLIQHPDYDICWLITDTEKVAKKIDIVNVYPNPSTDKIYIDVNSLNWKEDFSIKIVNITILIQI